MQFFITSTRKCTSRNKSIGLLWLETQVYIQNISGSGPFICVLQDASGQLIQQDTTSSIFYSFDPVVQGTYLITVSDSFSSCIDTIIIT